jgi:L-2,4-diaminobutyric acid acetyltransferase
MTKKLLRRPVNLAMNINFLNPVREDSPEIFTLIKRSPPLDLNSRYAYMLVATHFANTSIVAKVDGRIVGVVSAYCLPNKPETLFVWQVAVDKSMRGQGLAKQLIEQALMKAPQARWIETTITPSNSPSQKLFKSIASKLGTTMEVIPFLPKVLFGEDAHEDEDLYRIGPF